MLALFPWAAVGFCWTVLGNGRPRSTANHVGQFSASMSSLGPQTGRLSGSPHWVRIRRKNTEQIYPQREIEDRLMEKGRQKEKRWKKTLGGPFHGGISITSLKKMWPLARFPGSCVQSPYCYMLANVNSCVMHPVQCGLNTKSLCAGVFLVSFWFLLLIG